MPWGLKRYQETGDLHFITFSCYQRQPFLSTPNACRAFDQTLEDVRRWYGLHVKGYVVMPEQPPQQVRKEALVGGPGKAFICW